MKVYIVGINVYDEAIEVVGVFDSYEKAFEVQEELFPFEDYIYGNCDVMLFELELNNASVMDYWGKRNLRKKNKNMV